MVPNPFAPAEPNGFEHEYVSAQASRRSVVLATVRQQLTEQKQASLSLRSVSAQCGLSHQTVANLVGTGSMLIEAAMIDYVRAIAASSRRYPAPNPALASTELYWRCAHLFPEYAAAAIRTHFSLEPRAAAALHKDAVRVWAGTFRQMQQIGTLRQGVDIWSLANCASTLIPGLSLAWANGALPDSDFHIQLNAAICGLIRIGASAEHAKVIDAWSDSCAMA